MAIDVSTTTAATPPAEPADRPGRPAAPERGPWRWLRLLVGIREDVLDWVPANRPHYTAFGIIVLNTGLLAAAAMFSALTKIVSAPLAALVPAAMLWGWIILSIDRWLIASTHGVHQTKRFVVFAPRLVLAALIALTIAEPLTLRIFQPALDRQVRTTQANALVAYQSALTKCNPVSGRIVASKTCSGLHLSLANPPGSMEHEYAVDLAQLTSLQQKISAAQRRITHLTMFARDECAGVSGRGLTGIPGVGWQCRKDYAAVTSYRNSSGLGSNQRQLKGLDRKIANLAPQVANAQQNYANEVHTAISKKVAAWQKGQQGIIGLVDEWQALGVLSAKSNFVLFAHWLIWLILIALDCLPITAKIISGATAYDRLLTSQLRSDERIHDVDLRLREQRATADKDVAIEFSQITKQERIRRIGEDERVGRAQRETDLLFKVQDLADQWIREDETAAESPADQGHAGPTGDQSGAGGADQDGDQESRKPADGVSDPDNGSSDEQTD
jgi:hypothetical protein